MESLQKNNLYVSSNCKYNCFTEVWNDGLDVPSVKPLSVTTAMVAYSWSHRGVDGKVEKLNETNKTQPR